jgi:electron transfer flavoprotein alpha subunit
MSTIVVFVEHLNGAIKRASLEALGAARSVSDSVVAVIGGEGAAAVAPGLGAAGAAKVVVLTGGDPFSPDALARDIAAVIQAQDAKAFLVPATSTGQDVAPRVAALVDSTLLSDCLELQADGDTFTVCRPWLAGKMIATVRSTAPVLCATLRRNTFTPFEGSGDAEVSETAASTDGKGLLTGIAEKESGKLDVSEAPVVVAGGRGMKDAEGFAILDELAAAFGNAAVGASRAVVDAGWRGHADQVGQTGKTVSPEIYVAAGISGAIQHLAGMKTSKVIIAINKDPEAPIFKVANYGIVGDVFEVLPVLTEHIRTIRAEA